MNLTNIAKAIFIQQDEVNTIEVTYQNPAWHIDEHDGGFHIANDSGQPGQLTVNTLKVSPISVFIADCDCDEDAIYDTSSVADADFDLETALKGISPAWKLMEIVVQHDGLITLAFMDIRPDKYIVGDKGEIDGSNWETVTVNADLERLLMLIETENGQRNYIIQQNYVAAIGCTVTSITEIRDGVKVSRLYTEGQDNDETGLPLWYGTVYELGDTTPRDTSPTHHTDQPSA